MMIMTTIDAVMIDDDDGEDDGDNDKQGGHGNVDLR